VSAIPIWIFGFLTGDTLAAIVSLLIPLFLGCTVATAIESRRPPEEPNRSKVRLVRIGAGFLIPVFVAFVLAVIWVAKIASLVG
jgi:hypothetical protein